MKLPQHFSGFTNVPAILLMFLFSFSLNAQDFIASLKQNLVNETNDSLRAVWLSQVGSGYKLSNKDSALFYINQAISLANEQRLSKSWRDYREIKGRILDHFGQTDSARAIYLRLLQTDTLQYPEKAGGVFNRLGALDTDNGYYSRSLDYLLKALKFRRKYDPENESETLGKLALLFYANHDCEGGFEYAWRAKGLLKRNTAHTFDVYNSIGYLHKCQQNYDSAEYYFQNAYDQSQMQNSPNHGEYLHNIGYITETKGEKSKGLVLLKNALSLKEKYNSQHSVSLTHYALAEVYFEIAWNSNLSNYLDTALVHAEKAILSAKERADLRLQKKGNGIASDIHAAAGNLNGYYKHKNNFMNLTDALFNISRDAEMAQLESNYLLKEKEADNLRLINENLQKESTIERQYYFFIGAGVIILMIGVGFFIVYQNNKRIKALNLQIEASNKTKDRLFSIISHDLRGPIAAFETTPQILKSYVKKNQPEKINEMVDHIDRSAKSINQLLDNLLNWSLSQKEELLINIEKLAIRPIIDEVLAVFEETANAKEIRIESNIGDEFIMADRNTFSTVVRNLISNAIKFSHSGSSISINHRINDNWIEFTFSDKGTGMNEQQLEKLFTIDKSKVRSGTAREKGTGLGMVLVKEFVEMNKGELRVESRPEEGTTFYVSLPLAS